MGNAYITGDTFSTDFPTTPGVFDTSHNGDRDVYVTKLNANGNTLLYSTVLGGTDRESGSNITVDAEGNVYIVGSTSSPDFPTTSGSFDTTYNGGYNDAFVTKINAKGSELLYSTFLGGSGTVSDGGMQIKIDTVGNAYLLGFTNSTDFPTTLGAFDITFNGGEYDTFVTKINANGKNLLYSTFLGGGLDDFGVSLFIDTMGIAYVTGHTDSANFPVTPGAFDTSLNGESDAYVTKLNTNGSALLFSTFLGGHGYEVGNGIVVDVVGNIYVTGSTFSIHFPYTIGAYDTNLNGASDLFITKLNSNGSTLLYSTFVGGGDRDFGYGIVLDATGSVYVTGKTESNNFPTTLGAFDTNYNGTSDTFVTKLHPITISSIYLPLVQSERSLVE